ncbi:MAG: glycosyltransferase family 39 protein [Candidatus Micrarchaeota archaeon]
MDRNHALLALVFISAFALKLFFQAQHPLIHNNDAGYYVLHINEVLRDGYPHVADPPLAFYFAALFASFTGVMLGFKIAACLASAGIAFPVFRIAGQAGGSREAALLAAFLAAFSPTNEWMMGDLLKNMLGLFFGAWFVYFVMKAADRFSAKDAALAFLSAVLMMGSHFSSAAYVMVSVLPFLFLYPAHRFLQERRLAAEPLFCIALAFSLLAAGALVLAMKGIDPAQGKAGIIGIYGGAGLNAGFLARYALLLAPLALGLRALERKRLLLFVPWLLATILLAQPFFADPAWTFRFEWDAYFMVALLAAIGAGAMKDKPAFLAMAAVLAIATLAGFLQAAQSTHPIISEEEWMGLLELHRVMPEAAFSGMEGGATGYWVQAAGFPLSPEGGYLLVCGDDAGPQNEWMMGGCMSASRLPEEMMPAARERAVAEFGRFFVVRRDALPPFPRIPG